MSQKKDQEKKTYQKHEWKLIKKKKLEKESANETELKSKEAIRLNSEAICHSNITYYSEFL